MFRAIPLASAVTTDFTDVPIYSGKDQRGADIMHGVLVGVLVGGVLVAVRDQTSKMLPGYTSGIRQANYNT